MEPPIMRTIPLPKPANIRDIIHEISFVVVAIIRVVNIDKTIPIRKYFTLLFISFKNIVKIAPHKYPAKLKDAKRPAFVRVKKSSSIEGSNEVKANLATPTPIVIDNIPASNILKFLFLSKILYS
jgi:hypothetical protein